MARLRIALLVIALAGLIGGLAASPFAGEAARWFHIGATLPVLAALLVEIIVSLRRGQVGLDLVAALSMAAALLFGEALAGNVVALMYAGGQLLESFAEGRARREMTALRAAGDSTYARIVRLVETAQSAKAPVSRIADRFALWFLGLTLLLAGGAWALSGDHIRALAVLVVATPCPLILALPVALISGMSRAARRGVLIKTAGALEQLWSVRTAILDKTGTLTTGIPEVADIRTAPGVDAAHLLQLAASLDQASGHGVADALVREAQRRRLHLLPPSEVVESAGAGLAGRVGDHQVAVGGRSFVAARSAGDPHALHEAGDAATVAVAIDGELAGVIILADPLRPDAGPVLDGLREAGISRIVLASGDRQDVVDATIGPLAIDLAVGDLDPPAKLAMVEAENARAPTLMVGDGVNDAPALAVAAVGVAMGARGSAASSETADIVILVDQIGRLLEARQVANRTRQIASQSVFGGLALSILGMLAAAFGYLPPLSGALLQEAIDVVVILNALRVLL